MLDEQATHQRVPFAACRERFPFADPVVAVQGHEAVELRLQRGQFTRDVEILRLDRDPFHPPVTGGNSAISRASPIGVSSGANRWSIAARTRRKNMSGPRAF